jgi:SET domain-containing protein
MTKEEIIQDLAENVYCRIQRSAIHGVGVIAIKKIPKGTKPLLVSDDASVVPISEKEIMENKNIPDAVKETVKAFYAMSDGMIHFPGRSLNQIDISYFMNHADKPNIDCQEIGEDIIHVANRDIEIGEELTIDYSTFTDPDPEPCF